MRKEKPKIKTYISNVEDAEVIEKEIKNIQEKQSKPIVSNNEIENKIKFINSQISQFIPMQDYENLVRDNYNFLASMDCTDKSYELVENSLDIHFRKILYEGIIAFISDKNKAIEIYNSDHMDKLMKDINEYVSSMLHVNELMANDCRMKAYVTKLLQNIGTNMSFFYNLHGLSTDHRSYYDIMQYLLAFMTVIFPSDGKTV